MVSALSAAGDGMAAYYARRADEYERIDQRPERQAELRVIESALADAMAGRCFDAAFAGCWWSHLPLQRLPAWLAQLHALLPAGARVVFVDNTCVPGRSTPIARADDHGNGWQRRTLDDGSVHEVLKNHPTREQAVTMLGPRAVALRWTARGHFWVLDYGLA